MSDASVALSNTKKRKRKRNRRNVVNTLDTNTAATEAKDQNQGAALEDNNQSISQQTSKRVKINTVNKVNNKNEWNDNELHYDYSAINLDIETMPQHLQKYVPCCHA